MEKETLIISTLAGIGVPKEITLEIMHELMFNSAKYVDNTEAIETLLQSKLTIDELISLNNYKIF